MAYAFYTAEQKKLQAFYREAALEHIAPVVKEIDDTDFVPQTLVDKLVRPPFSLPALSVPKKFGGLEMDKVSIGIITEEIAYQCPALIPFLEIGQLYVHVILLGGTEEQQKRFLTRIAHGEIGAYALTDEGPGSDPAAMKCRATANGKGFVINGAKRLITFADMSDLFAVFATEDPAQGAKAISAFIVEKSAPGLKLVKHCAAMGLKGHRAFNLAFENMPCPAENRIGKTGDGLRLALKVLSKTRISLAFGFVGLARAAFDASVAFVKQREVAGRKLADKQNIQFTLAELATRIDAARLLAYRAAVMSHHTENHQKETSMAKYYAGDTLIAAVDLANRIYGGYGSDVDYPVERYLRDAYTWIAAQGTNEVQKLIVSREILKS
jgi:alkylation response protein AidB-like acyl-CoA dehydrogenase